VRGSTKSSPGGGEGETDSGLSSPVLIVRGSTKPGPGGSEGETGSGLSSPVLIVRGSTKPGPGGGAWIVATALADILSVKRVDEDIVFFAKLTKTNAFSKYECLKNENNELYRYLYFSIFLIY
jgi:hypothetical protein